jgi:hypothetical protein
VLRSDLLLICLGDHVRRHVSDAFVDDFSHRGHDPFRLLPIQPLPLQPLNEVMRVEMEIQACRRPVKRRNPDLRNRSVCTSESTQSETAENILGRLDAQRVGRLKLYRCEE